MWRLVNALLWLTRNEHVCFLFQDTVEIDRRSVWTRQKQLQWLLVVSMGTWLRCRVTCRHRHRLRLRRGCHRKMYDSLSTTSHGRACGIWT